MGELIYLLPLRYPTEKAYGVTIGNTISCISKQFDSTQIWCDSNVNKDSYGLDLISIKLPKIHRILRFPGKRLFEALNFYFRLIYFAGKTRNHFKLHLTENYIWTRHPLTLIFIYKSRKIRKIVLEFHQTPNFLDRFLTRRFIASKPVLVIGITEKSIKELEGLFPNGQIVRAEMGVPEGYLSKPDIPLPSKIKIGYVGKSTSSGNDNNLNLLVEGFSLLKSPEVILEFVGVEPQKKQELLEMARSLKIPQEKITFVDHVPHKNIRNIIAELSIGVLPYQWNEYNSHRFPIKLVEYSAAGLWILTDGAFADGLRLNEQLVHKYKTGDAQDLANKLHDLVAQISLTPVRNKYAIEFAAERTYIRRAELIAKEILRNGII